MATLPRPPQTDKDLTGQPWQKWFAAAFALLTKFTTTNNIVVDSSAHGVVLKDSAGHYWRLNVSTLGVVTTTDLGTNKP